MGELLIKPYEISVWEEKLTQDGFRETKLAVIGSDTMTGPNKVYDPIFNKKTSGEKTLTFSLKYQYFDPYSENEQVINPFATLLVNERKVKLHYDNQWYEFIIKDHSESSDGLTWTYTCTDAFVLELSKNGYNLEFSADLNNNQGTAKELAEKVLENTEWKLGDVDLFKQYVEEPIYNAKLLSIEGLEIINANNGSAAEDVQANTDIYLFYSYVKNKNGKFVQFILKDSEAKYTIDDKNVITATNYRIKTPLTFKQEYLVVENPSGDPQEQNWYELKEGQYVLTTDTELGENKTYYYLHRSFWLEETEIISIDQVDKLFQANRLSYSQKTTYDPVMGRTVNIYKVGDREVYEYEDNIYTTSDVVQNYIVNGDNFNVLEDGTIQGWNPYVDSIDNEAIQKLGLVTYPELEFGKKLVDLDNLSTIDGYLKVHFMGALTNNYLNTIFNGGFESNLSIIGLISRGDKFLFRWRAGRGELGNLQPVQSLGLMIAKYTRDTPGWGRYYYHLDSTDIVLNINGTPEVLNSIIEGGQLSQDHKVYSIDSVAQAPSTKYLYKDGDSYYYWDGVEGIFKLHSTIVNGTETVDPNSTFLPYYYLSGEVEKPLTQSVLDDPTVHYGIFVYTTDNAIEEEVQIEESFEEEYKEKEDGTQELVTPLPTEREEDVFPKFGTQLSVSYTNKQSISHTYTFTAGTTDTTDAACKYDAEKGLITLKDEAGITNYQIVYQEIAPVYFRDMQFTRYIEDANGKPVTIGNVPTATISPTQHIYFKPSDGTAAEDIETYSSIERFEEVVGEKIEPQYNENSEKNLSISASQSNCFNILQTIAETFECWIDLEVDHDERGYITYDKENKPNKYVYLREYVGKDNSAGFKYGINLQSIERTINSDEIVTKLIVDQSQSEYVDSGYVSISQASSNPSGEEYILNFDYYYNQGLLDREVVEEDKKVFIEAVKDINLELQELEESRRNLEAAITSLGSKRNVYSGLIDSAKEAQSEAIEDFQFLTKRTYEEYREWYNQSLEELTEPTELVEGEENEEASLFDEENVIDVLGKLYISSATINNYTGVLNNINIDYLDKRKTLKGSENHNIKIWTGKDEHQQIHLFVELDDYWPEVSFLLDGNEANPYQFTLSNKRFDIIIENDSTEWVLDFSIPNDYTISENPCTIHEGDFKTIKILFGGEETDGVEKQIKEKIEEKQKLVNDFNNKYIRFIQEGTWNSTDYIDSELYYLDALQVSNTSAQPTVTYTINVVEISQLEGLEGYLFDAGDKTYVEDTEFFGWANKNGVLTPAREEVIVSEVEWHLDEPDQNVITIQNYKTRFEDLFQRISAAVQTVQYNEATYAKISSLMDADGTINQDVLVASLNRVNNKSYNLTSDGSIIIDKENILIRNLTNPYNRVILNNEGIKVSSDGGVTWRTVINGYGINAGEVYTGKLRTDRVIIGSEESPSFRWDKSGISAYKSDGTALDAEGKEISAYDLNTFVRYDQYGLYGIKDNKDFLATSLEDIKDSAHFGVTWDGFFIKNSYPGGGRVEITSDNDFRVMNIPEGQTTEQEKIKIGALEWGKDGNDNPILSPDAPGATEAPTLYGIRIKNNDGDVVMQTGDDGNLEITGTITALQGDFLGEVRVGPTDQGQDHIIIDGTRAAIKSSNYQEGAGYGWMINKDGDAVFNNITARGAIKTAVFEYAEIQAVGGIFIFRPSSTIKSARINGNSLIVKVEKPALFAKAVYSLTEDTIVDGSKTYYTKGNYGYTIVDIPTGNPHENEYYEMHTEFQSWCKISNYTTDGTEPNVNNILLSNGLTHVYRILDVNLGTAEVTLENGIQFINGVIQQDQTIADVLAGLEGGALVDMGREDGSSNYGIGVNSSDNTVNLPRRAISLFETVINPNKSPKVSYKYRGILGTLPELSENDVDGSIYNANMVNTQGIYTDNMYIGDKNQYLAFYTDGQGKKHLKLKTSEFIREYNEETGEEQTWEDYINEVAEGGDAYDVYIDSSAGNIFTNSVISTILRCYIYKGGVDITHDANYIKTYEWKKINIIDGSEVQGWTPTAVALEPNAIQITANDVDSKAVFQCIVNVEEA